MKVADLYVRVSTDEQADKGYSQRDQDERLHRYCYNNNILVRNVIYEDHSAKTFNRPEWKKLLFGLKKNKGKIDMLLFTKWDRFSRNTSETYQVIDLLRKLGVEPQAIEQPLDMSVPENKMMLAFYLAQPEVENDRRALNVTYGMRRAMKEGRYMGHAPLGYINRTTADGAKYIAPLEPEASIIRWAFQEMAKGIFNTQQIYLQACEKGLKHSRSVFHFAMRNPVYCGRIFLKEFKDEESQYVPARHEALVSEALFDEVQELLNRRSRSYLAKVVSDEKFPFRGFLICPRCGKMLTASSSKGRNGYYHYYHCVGKCKERQKAEVINEAFWSEVKTFLPRKEVLRLYSMVLIEEYQKETRSVLDEKRSILSKIKDLENRLSNARDLIASNKIDSEDFKALKASYAEQIAKHERRLTSIQTDNPDIEGLLRLGMVRLLNFNQIARKASPEDLRKLIAAIFPEYFSYDGTRIRTARVNTILRYIYLINNELDRNKKGQVNTKINLSYEVGMAGFEPTTSCSQSRRDTGLRYIPNLVSVFPLSKGLQSNGFKMINPIIFVNLFCGEGGIRTRGTVTSTTV